VVQTVTERTANECVYLHTYSMEQSPS